jgi:hypothetical protein
VTDGRTRAAHAAAQQAAPLRDGVAAMEKLPVAKSRACLPVVRKLTAHLIDALAELGYCDHVTDPPATLARAASVSSGLGVISSFTSDLARAPVRAVSGSRCAWCSRNRIATSLALIFPAEAYAAR